MRTQVGKMKGGLILRGKAPGVWYGMIKADGKWKWTRLGKMTKHKAEDKRDALQEVIDKNWGRSIRPITFKELSEKWLGVQKLGKKKKTLSTYTYELETHLLPFFGTKQVDEIFPDTIEEFKQKALEKMVIIRKKVPARKINLLILKTILNAHFAPYFNKGLLGMVYPATSIMPTLRKLSATTVNYTLGTLKAILEVGVKWGHSLQNPAKSVNKLKEQKKRFEILTREELTALLNDMEDAQGRLLIMTACMTGMRLGEILAMKWQNFDFKNGAYLIKESYGDFGFDSPKTESSSRTVILPEPLIKALKEHKIAQREHQSEMNGNYQNQDLVFASELGTPVNPANVRNRVYFPALKKANIVKHVRFHDLRRTYTTLALEAESNIKHVQSQLGHKTLNMTLGVYAQVTDAKKLEEAAKLSAYVFGKPNIQTV